MKGIFRHLLAGTFLLTMLAACDDIKEDERFVPIQTIESNRTVILEDYTGQFCRNCPEGHSFIEDMEKQYGERFIPVSIHAGEFGIAVGANPKIEGLMQPLGNEMAQHRGITTYPSGIIDGAGPYDHYSWAEAVRNAMLKPALCELSGDFTYSGREIKGTVKIDAGESFTGRLGLWLLEDGIVSIQQNNSQLVTDYTHNNVWRATISKDVWGDPVTGTIGEESEYEFSFTLDEKWKPENCKIVAFVTDDKGTYLQAARFLPTQAE